MHCDYGEVLTELPQGFIPREQWPEYDLISTPPPQFHPKFVGKNPVGMRWNLGFLCLEEYISDDEPDLDMSDEGGTAPYRLILWRRLARTDPPEGWRTFTKKISRLEGFADIQSEEYWRTWSESARRYRKHWINEYFNKTYVIEEVSFEEFADAYTQSPVIKKTGPEMLSIAQRRIEHQADSVHYTECWGARRVRDGKLMAGIVTTTSPTCRGSYYLCGFYKEETRDEPLMVGVVDHWFRISLERGIRFLHFGQFWKKGDPTSWKGFSTFKSKFGLFYIQYPPALLHFRRGKLL